MADYFVSDVELTDVADAIREKGGTSAPLEWPGGFVEAIGDISGGGSGGGSLSDPIRFFDYDGTVVASYTSVPNALPDNPSHDGLVAQGWNYTLAQIQTQFAASGTCDIGQMYITESGDTEIDVSISTARRSPNIALCPNGKVTIDWGDGSQPDTLSGTSLTTRKSVAHTYATGGDYTIVVHVVSGTAAIYSSSGYRLLFKGSIADQNYVYTNCIRVVRMGSNLNIANNAFRSCHSLSAISIPSTITSIGSYAFHECYNLKALVIPSGVNSVPSYACYACRSLTLVSIPSSVSTVYSYAFTSCESLHSIVIPSGVSTLSANVFQYCYALRSVVVPSNVASIPSSAFATCSNLSFVSLPGSGTSISTYAFNTCHCLSAISIPSTITSIGNYAFATCYGLGEIHFLSTTPPTVSNSNAWSGVPTDCKIYVPTGSLSAYTSASNYPSSSTYTYIEE